MKPGVRPVYQPLVIVLGPKKGTLTGRLNAQVFEAVRDMPGRKKWVERTLHFEPSAANIEHLKAKLPEVEWVDEAGRLQEIENLRAAEQVAREQKRKALPPEAAKAFKFKRPPRDVQLRDFMLYRDLPFFGLFYEMGIGKSKVICDIAAHKWATGEIDCLLIVVWPSGLSKQWINKAIPADLPDWVERECDWYSPARRKRFADSLFEPSGKLRILAMNIEALSSESGREVAQRFCQSGKCMTVVDESEKIKTPGVARTKAAFKLRDESVVRAILSGTPIPKGLQNLWAQMTFLSPDVLGYNSYYTFRSRYCELAQAPGAPRGAMKITGYRNVKELWDKIDAHCSRVLTKDCMDVPANIMIERHIEMTKEQKKLYLEMSDKFVSEIEMEGGGAIKADAAIVRIMRLQQILCGHVPVQIFSEDEEFPESKMIRIPSNRAQAAVDVWEENGYCKMVVWGRFRMDMVLLKEAFEKHIKENAKHFRENNIRAQIFRYDGSIKSNDRYAVLEGFMKSKEGVFLATQSTGGTGLDGLQCADLVAFYSNSFKSSERWQAEARTGGARRVDVGGHCRYVDLIVPKSIDTHILKVLKSNKDIADAFLDDPEGWKKLMGGELE